MHLSPLSDGHAIDSLDDGGTLFICRLQTPAEAHRDGLIRGLVLMAVAVTLIGFGLVSSAIHAADADPSPFADDLRQSAADVR